GCEARLIDPAGHMDESMPRFVVEKVPDALNRHRKSVRGSRIHVLGVAYKAGVSDVRESPALNVMRLLREKGAELSYSDPFVPAIREEGLCLDALPVRNGYLGDVDCAVILTDHHEFAYAPAAATVPTAADTRRRLTAS